MDTIDPEGVAFSCTCGISRLKEIYGLDPLSFLSRTTERMSNQA